MYRNIYHKINGSRRHQYAEVDQTIYRVRLHGFKAVHDTWEPNNCHGATCCRITKQIKLHYKIRLTKQSTAGEERTPRTKILPSRLGRSSTAMKSPNCGTISTIPRNLTQHRWRRIFRCPLHYRAINAHY